MPKVSWVSVLFGSGFIGTILFVGPLLSRRELAAPWLIKFLFYALLAVVVWNVAAQYLARFGIAGWWMGRPAAPRTW